MRRAWVLNDPLILLVEFIDPSTPSAPVEVYRQATIGNAIGVETANDYIYVAEEGGGMSIYRAILPVSRQGSAIRLSPEP